MFLGTTPQVASNFIAKQLLEIKPKRVFIGCAGNFVIEQIAKKILPKCEIHSTDVTLYSCAIGWGLTDQDFRLDIKLNEFQFLNKYLDSPLKKAALVIYIAEVAACGAKDHKYYRDLFKYSLKNADKYIEKIILKLKKVKELIGDMNFYGIDNIKLWDKVNAGDYVYYDPPIYKQGYERMFKSLEMSLDWDIVEYTDLTDETNLEVAKKLTKRMAILSYMGYKEIKNPEKYGLKELFHYQNTPEQSYRVYSNYSKEKGYADYRTLLREEVEKYDIISAKDEIKSDSKIHIEKVINKIANHYRLMWLKKVVGLDAGDSFLVFINKKLIGLFVLYSGVKFSSEYALLLADPATPISRYKRLSKLILYIVSTKEVLNLFNEITMWEHKGFTTRANSNNPISMKYRGVFNLAKRKTGNNGYKYCLIYRSKILNKTIQDGLNEWIRKHSQYLN